MPFRRTGVGSGVLGATATFAVLAGTVVMVGCARPSRPPGGPEDRVPPMVVGTWPDTFQTIEPTRDPVRITFSERISERTTAGPMTDAVLVSPETGAYEVKHTRSGLEIKLLGGFRPGLVYRIRVLNTIRDMFANPLESPFELVFSTGGEYEQHVLAGVVTDRITGEKIDQARVEARPVVDGAGETGEAGVLPVYVAKTDTAGIYLLRYVPSGEYEISVYQDSNRNREPDFRERQGTSRAHLGLLIPRQDTIISEVALLQPDTSEAQLIRVVAEDSLVLRFEFDDFLDIGGNLAPTQVVLSREEGESPQIGRLLRPHQMDSVRAFQDSVRAVDSLLAVRDSLIGVADSLETAVAELLAAGDTLGLPDAERALRALLDRLEPRPVEGPEPEEDDPLPPPPILPAPAFFAILLDPLVPNQLYQVQIQNVRNINGLTGGGGEASVTWEPPDPPSEASGGVGSGATPPLFRRPRRQ